MALITLRVLDGSDRGRVFEDLPTPVTIGREEGNSVQLNDERVSRFHLKIQEDQQKLVLTDLESTNGTKVNGEDIQLRILRHGDMICVGRSVLLFGSARQISERLAAIRQSDPAASGTLASAEKALAARSSSVDVDVNWHEAAEACGSLHHMSPPELPDRLTPGQAAQMSELLEYLHVRIRDLLGSVKIHPRNDRITLDERQWQSLLDLQAQLAVYLRQVGGPAAE
jgi:pSer/pThr/pTyr-binding forkhead associated (FHA) protein